MFCLLRASLTNSIPVKKIVVWGHNTHVRYSNEGIAATDEIYPAVPTRHMGSWLIEKYKDNIYTIAFYAFRGSAANNSRKVYEIPDAEKGTIEQLLSTANGKHVFVDLAPQKNQRGTSWMYELWFARYNGQYKQSMIVKDQFDAIWLVRNVSPPRYLY